MPELGKYAFTVLASYGVTLGLLAAIIAVSIWSAKRSKSQLEALERDVK